PGLYTLSLHDALPILNELFNALLDISKLDAGVLTPSITEFPFAKLLERVDTTFTGAAQEKGLSLRVITSSAWVRSDFILLERIVDRKSTRLNSSHVSI